ncbi:MAG TPA: hypothetical protein VGH13_25730 [Xanthobacteraceae bacterium]
MPPIAAQYWFLWVRCSAGRTFDALDLRTLDRHCDAAVTMLIPTSLRRERRSNTLFAGFVRLSRTSIADEKRDEHRLKVPGE